MEELMDNGNGERSFKESTEIDIGSCYTASELLKSKQLLEIYKPSFGGIPEITLNE